MTDPSHPTLDTKALTPLYDSEGLKILTEQECRDLLGTVPLGRIVFTDRALPAIQPVHFAMADGNVIILTSASSKLASAADDTVVAFEVDEFDQKVATGWSVVIVGHARVLAGTTDLCDLRALPLTPWAEGDEVHYIAITPELISGRSLPKPTAYTINPPEPTKPAEEDSRP